MSSPQRVLVVDDDALLLALVRERLSQANLEVETVCQPTLVVPRAVAFKPDLVLLDFNMPILSGAEVLCSLRTFPETRSSPIAFLTGGCTEDDLLRVLRMGVNDVLVKPFDEDHVARVLELLRTAPAASGAAHFPPLWDTLRNVYRRNLRAGALVLHHGTPFEGRIQFQRGEFVGARYAGLEGEPAALEMLLVENGAWVFEPEAGIPEVVDPLLKTHRRLEIDSHLSVQGAGYIPSALVAVRHESLRNDYEETLVEVGFRASGTGDGQTAFERAVSQPPDVILCSLALARLDGWGLIRKLRDDHRTREIRVICMDVNETDQQMLATAQAGADAYMPPEVSGVALRRECRGFIAAKERFITNMVNALQGNTTPRVPVNLDELGPLWLLRQLAAFEASGDLEVRDDWGTYRIHLHEGGIVHASTGLSRRMATGMAALAALAALVVSRQSTGTFVCRDAGQPPARVENMGEMIERATSALNRLEQQVTERWLTSAPGFVVDEILYELYQRVANGRHATLARALCVDRVKPAELPDRIALPPHEIQEVLRDLLRRRVIEFVPETG